MPNASGTEADKVCYVCGVEGFVEYLVTCCHCKKVSEHVYCMYYPPCEVPPVWYCEECLSSSHAHEVFAAVIIAAALISSSWRRRN